MCTTCVQEINVGKVPKWTVAAVRAIAFIALYTARCRINEVLNRYLVQTFLVITFERLQSDYRSSFLFPNAKWVIE